PSFRSRALIPSPYFLRIDCDSLTPLSFAHCGDAGSLPNTSEIAPLAAFCGTIDIRADAEETSLTKICGFQPSRDTALKACSENLPKAKIIKTFAFDAFNCVTCGWTSAEVGSYPTFATIDLTLVPRPRRRPASRSRP